jgi:talin
MQVKDACTDIYEKLGDKAPKERLDYSLFSPAQSKWLQPTKTFQFYDIKSGDEMEYKNKQIALRIRLQDGSVKTILIDETLPVEAVVEMICKRIGDCKSNICNVNVSI